MTVASTQLWFYWALLSAVFASLTAIFAKIGLDGCRFRLCHADSYGCDSVRHRMVRHYTGKWRDLSTLSSKNWSFLTLSGLATGASWLCYFRALQMGEAAKVAAGG
jgi:transporter family protein